MEISKTYRVTKKQVMTYINSLESSYKTKEKFKADIVNMMNTELVQTDKCQIRFFKAVVNQLSI